MLGEVVDARRQQRDLDLGRAGVALVRGELADHLGLLFLGQAHDRETVAAFDRRRRRPARRPSASARPARRRSRSAPRRAAAPGTPGRSVCPYRSPSKPIRCASTSRSPSFSKVGRTPMLTAAGRRPYAVGRRGRRVDARGAGGSRRRAARCSRSACSARGRARPPPPPGPSTLYGRPEQLGGARHVALGQQRPDPARRDRARRRARPARTTSVSNSGRDREQGRVARRAVAEAEVRADAHRPRAQRAGKHLRRRSPRPTAATARG